MSYVVTLESFRPGERYDNTPWVQARIEQSAARTGPWTVIDTQPLDPVDPDPADPQARDFTTDDATIPAGWFRVAFTDAASNEQISGAVFFPAGPGYTDIVDLRDALAPGGDQGPATAAALSDSELVDAITEADGEIDARLADRYTVPFDLDQVPPLVAQLTRDIAAYLATLTHRRHQALADNHPVVLRYRRAQGLLADLQAGRSTLEGTSPGGDPDADGEATVVNGWEGDLFSLDSEGIYTARGGD